MSVQDYSQPAMKAVFPALDGFGLSLAPDGITAKRVLDVALASLAILLFLPLFAADHPGRSLLDSRGPVLFRQRRAGEGGKLFGIYKFRSMHVLEDGTDIVQATKGDARITRVGRFLRASSLDELPQLFNVLSGEMSLVGPRPHAIAHDEYYAARIANYRLRQLVKPGITGWAQVHGARGATTELADMQRRIDLDAWYVAHESLWLDLVILARTPLEVLSPQERGLMQALFSIPAAFEIHQAPQAAANDSYGEVTVGGIKTACVSRDGLAQMMLADCLAARETEANPKLVFASNGHAIALAAQRREIPRHLRPGRHHPCRWPGGGVRFALLTQTPIPERSATTDFIHDAAALAAEHGLRFFLLGATEEANAKAAEILQATYPGLQIVGRRHGYFSHGRGRRDLRRDQPDQAGCDLGRPVGAAGI